MLFTKDQHMIQALAAKRPDQAFNIWVLPGRARCDRAVANPRFFPPVRESLSVSTIIVAGQIARRRIPRKCLGDLLCQPLRRGMLGYREPEKLRKNREFAPGIVQSNFRMTFSEGTRARCNPVPHARLVAWQGFTPEKLPASSLLFLGQVPQNVWCTT